MMTMLTPLSGEALHGDSHQQRRRALLGSLCLFLSAIEYLIPKPLPFMRIGLANLPLLLALDIFGAKDFFLLVLLKVLGQGIIGGTFFSYVFLFSLAGTCSSAVLMHVARKLAGKKRLGFAGLGCLGAMASNAVQLVLARYFIFGPALRYLIPPFLASGLISGIALGLACEYFCRRSRWYARLSGGGTEAEPVGPIPPQPRPGLSRKTHYTDFLNADELFIAGLLMALIFLFSPSLPDRAAQFFFFYSLALLSGKKINPFVTALIMGGIVFVHLLAPYGKVLLAIGPLRVTRGSLLAGLEKAITLEGLLMLSQTCIRSSLKLPGAVGSLLGESLRLLELMRERKGLISKGHIIGGIDRLMLELETADIDAAANATPRRTKRSVKNIILLITIVLITAALSQINQPRP
ncbi:MAG: Gx transporter family protein [Treponema sp.]|jgi:heptaprenyl diphosphate synthase|nr:Gx transporter family protein [Treponema sp.]